MHALNKTTGGVTDELSEMFSEMRGHLYLHAGTLLLKMAQEKLQQWRTVVDLAGLCYLLAYQVKECPPLSHILFLSFSLPTMHM